MKRVTTDRSHSRMNVSKGCVDPLVLGHPVRGTHKKIMASDEQELRELARLKHYSHGLKNQHLG
jgi:hypothetical protein